MSRSTEERRSRSPKRPLGPLLVLCLSTSLAHAQHRAPVLKPVEAKRPAGLVGRWCGPGLCITLKPTGHSLISEVSPASEGGLEERALERGLWWVEGRALCLTVGLESSCEPYLLNQSAAQLTLKGLTLTRREPKLKAPKEAP